MAEYLDSGNYIETAAQMKDDIESTNWAHNSSDWMGTEIDPVPWHEVYCKPKAVSNWRDNREENPPDWNL